MCSGFSGVGTYTVSEIIYGGVVYKFNGVGSEDVPLLERCPYSMGRYVQGWDPKMCCSIGEVSLFRVYIHASLKLGPEYVFLLERCRHFRCTGFNTQKTTMAKSTYIHTTHTLHMYIATQLQNIVSVMA